MARGALRRTRRCLDILIDHGVEARANVGEAATERPHDKQVQARFNRTAVDLDRLLRLRAALVPRR